MSSRKSCFLWEEHAQDAVMLWRVAELERQLESARRESQDRATEATEARAAELLATERATAAERRLDAAKVRQAKTKAALQKSLVETKVAL